MIAQFLYALSRSATNITWTQADPSLRHFQLSINHSSPFMLFSHFHSVIHMKHTKYSYVRRVSVFCVTILITKCCPHLKWHPKYCQAINRHNAFYQERHDIYKSLLLSMILNDFHCIFWMAKLWNWAEYYFLFCLVPCLLILVIPFWK